LYFTELECSVAALALAWVAKNPSTSTVILGASRPQQILDNLEAIKVLPKLTPEVMDKIEHILQNAPESYVSFIVREIKDRVIEKKNFFLVIYT
jgi:aryl-alcohol dehydrogenase-like predicted oxidoreductase